MFTTHQLRKVMFAITFMLFPLVSMSAGQVERQDVASWPEWYLEKNLIDMNPENRFVGSVNLHNPGASPVYVRASVKRISLGRNGVREIIADESGTLRVFPDEMVLSPGGSFTARMLVDAKKMATDSQSYYVHFEDVSNLQVSSNSKAGGGIGAGFLLAYDVMVAVHLRPKDELKETDIAFIRSSEGKLVLTNKSGQHIYLNRGYACPTAQTQLVDCGEWPTFPRQTLLPGETLTLAEPADAAARHLGLLVYPVLNSRRLPNRFYLPIPAGPMAVPMPKVR